jgi:hypothetical protein
MIAKGKPHSMLCGKITGIDAGHKKAPVETGAVTKTNCL